MKYYVIAGEASGDLHGSNLLHELKQADEKAQFRCWGGDLMQAQGGVLVKHFRDLAFMGLYDVLMNIRTISKNIDLCKKDIIEYQPDAVILVDYPGFNLRIAEFAKNNGFKVFYYISPKIWAWKKSRAYKIKKFIDRMFVIFPFEIDFYKQYDYEVEYVGNPLLDEIDKKIPQLLSFDELVQKNKLTNQPIIALVAGSRKQEIRHLLPEMLSLCEHFPDYQFIITGAPSIEPEFYETFLKNSNAKVIYNQTYEIIKVATAALVTSGTATLETALLGTPEVVCYKTGALTFRIAKMIVKVKFFSLPNIIADHEIVKELLQFNLSEEMKKELSKILFEPTHKAKMLENFRILRQTMGNAGASKRSAERIVQLTKIQ